MRVKVSSFILSLLTASTFATVDLEIFDVKIFL